MFACGIWNPENLWLLKFGIREIWVMGSRFLGFRIRKQVKESEFPVTIGIRNPSSNDRQSSTWNSKSTAGNLESKTVLDYLKHGTTVKRAMLFLEMINVQKIVFKIVFIERTCRDVNYVTAHCTEVLWYLALKTPQKCWTPLKVVFSFIESM